MVVEGKLSLFFPPSPPNITATMIPIIAIAIKPPMINFLEISFLGAGDTGIEGSTTVSLSLLTSKTSFSRFSKF